LLVYKVEQNNYKMKYYFAILISVVFCMNANSQYLKNLQGQPFSDEVLESVIYDTKGQSTTLANVLHKLKGNIVLIDFWASWCKTCQREMPYSKQLQKGYEEEKVAFLFLSTDTDYKKWIRGLATINIEGHHYRIDVESKKAIKEFLKIRGIPYYVILDKSSHIYDPKAKWPHHVKLKNSIDLLLQIDP